MEPKLPGPALKFVPHLLAVAAKNPHGYINTGIYHQTNYEKLSSDSEKSETAKAIMFVLLLAALVAIFLSFSALTEAQISLPTAEIAADNVKEEHAQYLRDASDTDQAKSLSSGIAVQPKISQNGILPQRIEHVRKSYKLRSDPFRRLLLLVPLLKFDPRVYPTGPSPSSS